MSDIERRLADAERRIEGAQRVAEHLAEVVRALSERGAAASAIAVAVQQDVARLSRVLDGPPSLPERVARVEAQQTMQTPQPPTDRDGWQDNAERGVLAWLSARPANAAILAVVAIVALLLLTDGGREVLGYVFRPVAGAIDAVEGAVSGPPDSTAAE